MFVGVYSASWQSLEILKTNHSVLWLYLEILKTNSVLWPYLVSYIDVKRLRYSRASLVHQKKIKEHVRVVKMGKKRLRDALVVLDAVKSKFPEAKEFIDDTLKDECQKEKSLQMR